MEAREAVARECERIANREDRIEIDAALLLDVLALLKGVSTGQPVAPMSLPWPAPGPGQSERIAFEWDHDARAWKLCPQGGDGRFTFSEIEAALRPEHPDAIRHLRLRLRAGGEGR